MSLPFWRGHNRWPRGFFGTHFRWYFVRHRRRAVAVRVLDLAAPETESANNESTPWMGIEERVNIYATMLWFAILSIGLLRAQGVELGHRAKVKIVKFSRAGKGRPEARLHDSDQGRTASVATRVTYFQRVPPADCEWEGARGGEDDALAAKSSEQLTALLPRTRQS